MNSIIQLLPEQLINQIAAGEVVQRPASVIKELLENSIDAGATSIEVILKDAGKTLIQVIDNGKGMTPMDAIMSFERHTTSKIKTTQDLFNLTTLGFRGEALASISSVAQVTLLTRITDQELGTLVEIEGNKLKKNEPIICAKGSNLSVKNLFFNVPARRNFLKSNAVEIKHLLNEFIHISLCHPEIILKFTHQDQLIFDLTSTNLAGRIQQIYDGISAKDLLILNEETTAVNFYGYVGSPSIAKNARGEQFFFVNNRFVRSNYLNHAVQTAFESLIPKGHFPFFVLFIHLDPSKIDINIHPTKTEIKFDDEHSLYAILRSTIKHSLGQFNVAPILDFDRDPNLDTPYQYKNKEAEYPTIQVDSSFNPFANEKPVKSTSSFSSSSSYKKSEVQPSWESLYVGLEQIQGEEFGTSSFETEAVSSSLFDDVETEHEAGRTFQIHKKYIFSTIKSGMLVINQGRAHQRILYEEFLTNITVNKAPSQQLLFPLELFYSVNEMEMIKELQVSLEALGFVFEAINDDSLVISGIPVRATESQVSIVIDDLLNDLYQGISTDSYSLNDSIAKSLSKCLAIKTGTYLTEKEQENLVNNLFACKEPNITPFNKPTFITLSVDDLDKKFAI